MQIRRRVYVQILLLLHVTLFNQIHNAFWTEPVSTGLCFSGEIKIPWIRWITNQQQFKC